MGKESRGNLFFVVAVIGFFMIGYWLGGRDRPNTAVTIETEKFTVSVDAKESNENPSEITLFNSFTKLVTAAKMMPPEITDDSLMIVGDSLAAATLLMMLQAEEFMQQKETPPSSAKPSIEELLKNQEKS